MRVIAGSAKGRVLKTPASITRPTMDRVRAAIFSMLGERVTSARVLDLFAGTGAIGIEALSRGATSVTFVDQDKKSAEVIRQNLFLTKFSGQIKQQDVITYLHREREKFDLIFADPPYATNGVINFIAVLLKEPQLLNVMVEDALLIVECEKQQVVPEISELEKIIDRTYGVTRILIFRKITPV